MDFVVTLIAVIFYAYFLENPSRNILLLVIAICSTKIFFNLLYSLLPTKRKFVTETASDRRRINKNYPELNYFDMKKLGIDSCMLPNPEQALKSVINKRSYVENTRGSVFHLQKWKPKGSIKATVFFIHGYSACSLYNYAFFCECLASEGFRVYAMDGFGHGLSDGLHCYLPSFEDYVEDYFEVYSPLASKPKNQKAFLVSLSMGGAVSLCLLRKYSQFAGAVFISPMTAICKQLLPPKIVIKIGLLMAYLFPTGKLTPLTKFGDIFYNNQKIRKAIGTYPLFYNERARLKTSLELYNASKNLQKVYKEIKLPILVMHGKEDKVTSPEESRKFYEKASSTNKKYLLYDGERHGLLFDSQASQVFTDIVSWISQINDRD